MKKIFFVTLLFAFTSCKFYAPTFKSISQWRVTNITSNKITLSNNATFNNPNAIDGMKVGNLNLELRANGKKLGIVTTDANKMSIPKSSDFTVPFSVSIDPKDIVGSLGSIINVAMGQKIDIQCVGDLKVGYSVLQKNIAINQTVPLSLSDIKLK